MSTQLSWWKRQTPEKQRAIIAARDPEKVKANDRARYYRNHEKRRALSDEYQRVHPEQVAAAKTRWAEKNTEKRKAQWAANNAVRNGKLTPQPCETCGTTERVQKHHDDYSKPLNVRWLCARCHGIEHRRVTR
jgi:ribosomal protein S27AE